MSDKQIQTERPACNCASTGVCCGGAGGWGGSCYSDRILRLVIIFAAVILYTFHLTGDLYGDEGHSFRTVSQGVLMENLNQPNSCHPPLFFALAKMFWLMTGKMWAIRLPSLIASVGTLLVSWPLAKRLLGEKLVTPALLFVGFSPLIAEFAVEARPYAMLAFFSTTLIFLMARFAERETWLDAVLLAVVASAGLMTHYIFAAQLVFVACWYLAVRRKLTLKSLAALILFIPVGVYLVTGAMDDAGFSKDFTENWRKHFSWLNFMARMPFALVFGYCTFSLGQLGSTRQVGSDMAMSNLPAIAMCGVFFVSFVVGLVYSFKRNFKPAILLAGAIIVPVVIGLLGGKAGFYLLREKYFIGSIVPLELLILLGFASLPKARHIWLVPLAAYGLVVSLSLYNYIARAEEFSRRTFRSDLNAKILENAKTGDAVVSYYINRVEPWYFSSLDEFGNVIDFRDTVGKRATEQQAEAAAIKMDSETAGDIYLIDREMDRNATDPKNAFYKTLDARRSRHSYQYGRNLLLHVFSSKTVEAKSE